MPSKGENMIHSSQFSSQLKLCKLPQSQRYSLPFECYWDAFVYEQERMGVFANQWLGLGRADRLNQPGEYEVFELCGQTLLLIRDQKDALRLYANTCRHRGARLLQGSGQCQAISCPFHGWTYALDGSLIGVKSMTKTEKFNPEDFPLLEYKLDRACGFLFAFLGDNPPELKTQLVDFAELHQPWSLEGLVTTRRRVFEVGCNWKVFLDVFNEYYHLNNVHPTSIGNIYLKPEVQNKTLGEYASQFGRTSGTGALLESQQQDALPKIDTLGELLGSGTRYTWIFPNMTFAAGQESIWVYQANPIGPNRCEVRQSICFPRSTIELIDFEEKSQAYYQRLDDAMDEDIVALENQQQGLSHSPSLQGRFSTLMESNVASFASWYADKLTDA
jgi:phenylpropionate dioxygenase-like ring-hydroxylating dioxygenase large terminal subunit